MKRKDALTALRTAGYHDDRRTWTHLYVENRISFHVAENAWNDGRRAKIAGVKCNCHECREVAS